MSLAQTTPSRSRERTARAEPLHATPHAPGMIRVSRLGAADGGAHSYVVDLRAGVCECPDFEYRQGEVGSECKHVAFLRLISAGELCARCGYADCRPSCPERDSS